MAVSMDVRVWYGARLCLLCVGASLIAALRACALFKNEGFPHEFWRRLYTGDRGWFGLTTPNALTDSLDSLTNLTLDRQQTSLIFIGCAP